MRTVNIFDFSKKTDRDTLQELFMGCFRRQSIVPFFGSGFTRGCPAGRGRVPSVDELKTELINIVAEIENYSKNERAELVGLKLSELADIFWPTLGNEKTPQAYRDRFDSYIEGHFCHVHDLSVEQKRLIDCRWRYLYTLNYDDGIEQASKEKLRVIAPYSKQNQHWLAQQRCLYKIHGDSAKFLETGESKYCILSTKQYLDAMGDRENQAMSQNLETDFSSNNIIFFGCSLLDELDILLAAGTKLTNKKQQNTDTSCYYVRYVDDETPPLSLISQKKYENFAISDIINVKAECMEEFYSFLAGISDEMGRLQETDSLRDFMGFQFLRREATDRVNIDYVFFSSHIWPKKETKEIVLPSFFMRRDTTQQVVDAINAVDGNFHVLRGCRLSGKTYALVDLLKEFQSRDTYYFASNRQISNRCFERLLAMKNAILIFDEHTLTSDQIGDITSKYREKIKDNAIQIVTAVDRSSGTFTKHYFDHFPGMAGFVKIYSLDAKLSNNEAERFNAEFGKLGLRDYESGWSWLDFMLKIDEASLKKHGTGLPDINIIRDIETLKTLILFTNQESIPISQGNAMGITETLYGLCKTADVAIQKDYLSEVELAPDIHDSFRFVTNSKYWVYKCLSTYAKNSANYNVIADAFCEISSAIQRQYNGRFGSAYYQAIKPYYFFDTIQLTFFSDSKYGGSLLLPELIYKKLLPLFKDDFQFLHQKAKCLLWNSRRKRNERERSEMLNEALQQITRASKLAEKRAPDNLEYTLYHMEVTKTLILANNWRFCQSQFSDDELSGQLSTLLKAFYEMECQMELWGDDSDLDHQEMEDLRWFVFHLADSKVRQLMLPTDRKTAGNIMTLWRNKKL